MSVGLTAYFGVVNLRSFEVSHWLWLLPPFESTMWSACSVVLFPTLPASRLALGHCIPVLASGLVPWRVCELPLVSHLGSNVALEVRSSSSAVVDVRMC